MVPMRWGSTIRESQNISNELIFRNFGTWKYLAHLITLAEEFILSKSQEIGETTHSGIEGTYNDSQ